MTKRIKLLSVMVAAVLCFTAGLAILFGSNNTAKADDAIPEVTAPTVASKTYAAAGNVKFQNAEAATGDWIFVKMTVIKGTKGSRGSDNNGFISTISTDKTISHLSGETYKGYLHNVEPLGVSYFEGLFTAADADKVVTFAVNLTNGELSVDYGDGYTTAAKYAGIEAIEGGKYFAFITNSSKIQGFVKDVVFYDENGTDLGLWTNMEETAPIVDASGIAGGDYTSQSAFWVASKTATTSNWIILEWDNDEGNTTVRTGGGWTYGVALGDQSLNDVTATGDNIWHDFGGEYFGATSAGKHVKITVNTQTGVITGFIDGVANSYATRPVEGLSAVKFRAGVNSAYSCNSTIYNFKAYDENGNDLGVETNMVKYVNLGALEGIDTSNVVGEDFVGSGTKTLYNKTATSSEWIIFEWNNAEGNSVVAGGGHMFSYGLGATQQSTELISLTDRTQLLTTTGNVKVAFHTKTGNIYRSFNGSAWATCPEGTVNKDGESGPFYAGILWNNGNVTYAAIDGLKCYDENGNDLGVTTNFSKYGTIANDIYTLTGHGGFGRFQDNVNYVDLEGNATTATAIGKIAAKKYGTEATTLEFVSGGDALQLFYPSATNADAPNWDPEDSSTYTWSMFDNQWYLVEAGTLFGSVVLAEDIIVRIHGSQMQIFKADYEFAITYTGVDGASHDNPATRTFLEAVEIAPATKDGAIFDSWDNASISAGTFGDITVTAMWKSVDLLEYNLTIGSNLALVVEARDTGAMSLTAVFTTVVDGEIAITKTVNMNHHSNEVPGKILLVNFTFDGILPQHLNDNVNVKIMYNDIVMAELDVVVAEYLDAKVAEAGADAALAQDVLYYGAAAQLYTNHDVENVVADLSAATPVEIPADASVYAKAGEKDANYYWYEAKVVYDNTVKLVLTIVAPADSAITVAYGADEIAATVNEAGLYEVAFAVPAHAFGTSADLTIKVDGEAVGQVLTYSVNSYIVNAPATDADYATLLERLYCLGVSAAAAYANA